MKTVAPKEATFQVTAFRYSGRYQEEVKQQNVLKRPVLGCVE
jgi:hypothetical protein